MCRMLLAGFLVALLGACSTTKYVKELPPVDLLAECPSPIVGYSTNADLAKAIIAYRDALALCNIDKSSLRDWAKDEH
jgi:hypothetical protein